MLAVGHLSVAYLVTRGLKRFGWPSMSIPLVWVFSILPDLDLLMPGVRHMGPTHSIIFAIAVFLPLFLYKGREVVPYFLAYASHILGDMITNIGVWLLWPLSRRRFGVFTPYTYRPNFSANLELVLFGLFVLVFVITRDYEDGLYSSGTKLLSLIPFSTLLVPLVFSVPVPMRLILPHIILMVVVLQPLYPTSWTRAPDL